MNLKFDGLQPNLEDTPLPKTPYRDPDLNMEMYIAKEQTYGRERFSDEELSRFFGIEDMEPYQIEDLRNYIEYVGKRLVNSFVNNEARSIHSKEAAKIWLEEYPNMFAGFALHDVAHTAIEYEKSGEKGVVPKFFEEDMLSYDKETFEDEMRSLVWWAHPVTGKPFSVALLYEDSREELKYLIDGINLNDSNLEIKEYFKKVSTDIEKHMHDDVSFEDYLKNYLEVAGLAVLSVFENELKMKSVAKDEAKIKHAEFFEIIKNSIANPPQDLVDRLRRIYDGVKEGDEQILFREFEKAVGPLLKRLRNRREI